MRRLRAPLWLVSPALAAVAGVVLFLGSVHDHSLILPRPNIGLLQHPAIWAFLALQATLPVVLERCFRQTELAFRTAPGDVLNEEGGISCRLEQFMNLDTRAGRATASLAYLVGLGAFIWNTFQNQRPGITLPFDFWDSITFPFGFWVTRVYKLYIFGWLLPYLATAQMGLIFMVLRSLRLARLSGRLELKPCHPDGVGGLGFIPNLAGRPVLLTVAMCSVPVTAATFVHRGPAATPLVGISLLVIGAVIGFVLPILFLRVDIRQMKAALIERIHAAEEQHLAAIPIGSVKDMDVFRRGNEALDYYERLRGRVTTISEYPYLKRFASVAAVILSPSLLLNVVDLIQKLLPYLKPLLVRP